MKNSLAPSFEPMMAGVSVGADSFIFTTNDEDIIEDEAITYETIIVDKENNESTHGARRSAIHGRALLSRHLSFGAAARSDMRRTGCGAGIVRRQSKNVHGRRRDGPSLRPRTGRLRPRPVTKPEKWFLTPSRSRLCRN